MLEGRQVLPALLPWGIPIAAAGAKRQEGIILSRGVPLDERQLHDAMNQFNHRLAFANDPGQKSAVTLNPPHFYACKKLQDC
jgi:hypothetical protein